MRRTTKYSMAAAYGVVGFMASMANGRGLTPGNIVVVRVGDGAAALTTSATPTYLEEFQPWTGTSAVQVIPMPTVLSGSNKRFTLSGRATSEAHLKRSLDGNYLTLGGFDADVGTASVNATTSAAVNRVIARIAGNGAIDTSTALTDAYGGTAIELGQIRSVISDNGLQFWTAGSGVSMAVAGVRYVSTLGAITSVQISATFTNTRVLNVFSNQLYVSSDHTGSKGVFTVGSPPPPTTAGQTMTLLPGFDTNPTTVETPVDYFFANSTTLYVSDERAVSTAADTTPAGASGGIQKWQLSGGIWTRLYTLGSDADVNSLNNGLPAGARGLAGYVNNTTGVVTLYFTTAAVSDNALMRIDDAISDTGPGGSAPPHTMAQLMHMVATNEAYRGISFAPGVLNCTPGDVNNDTRINGADISAFMRVKLTGNGTALEHCAADGLTVAQFVTLLLG